MHEATCKTQRCIQNAACRSQELRCDDAGIVGGEEFQCRRVKRVAGLSLTLRRADWGCSSHVSESAPPRASKLRKDRKRGVFYGDPQPPKRKAAPGRRRRFLVGQLLELIEDDTRGDALLELFNGQLDRFGALLRDLLDLLLLFARELDANDALITAVVGLWHLRVLGGKESGPSRLATRANMRGDRKSIVNGTAPIVKTTEYYLGPLSFTACHA